MLAAREMTPNALGVLCGMRPGHIAHILSGRIKTVNADTLLAIARALGVTTDWLLTGEGPIDRASLYTDPRAAALSRAASVVATEEPSPTPAPVRARTRG